MTLEVGFDNQFILTLLVEVFDGLTSLNLVYILAKQEVALIPSKDVEV